jgi:hypothetical protein
MSTLTFKGIAKEHGYVEAYVRQLAMRPDFPPHVFTGGFNKKVRHFDSEMVAFFFQHYQGRPEQKKSERAKSNRKRAHC